MTETMVRQMRPTHEMWMNLQRDYDLSIVRRDKATEIAETEKLAA